jgi:signal transduction histidine kinase
MITGGGKRLFRLGARPVEHVAEHERGTQAEEISGGRIPHLSLAALSEPEQLSRTTHANDGSSRDAALDPEIASAVEHERRRIAADVHDLIMQDLALALAQARMLADDTPRARTVVDAGERALAGARDLVGGLSARQSESIASAVSSSAQRAARHVPITVVAQDVPAVPQPDAQTFSTIVHITREAVTNAVKHGRAARIEVTLECPEEWRLRVSDDGCGFDAQQASQGFGLQSMRRQAHALGGRLRVTSGSGEGTTVEALLP